jgi:hypothetical protein
MLRTIGPPAEKISKTKRLSAFLENAASDSAPTIVCDAYALNHSIGGCCVAISAGMPEGCSLE